MLVSNLAIESNLRRTASKGLISVLDQVELEYLAMKYFGVRDEFGDIIGYQCPYSGEVYTDSSDIVLEHIIPVNSKGGTVLFNCIPTSKEVNGADQKGAKHLINWWVNSEYWDEDAPERLEKLVNYMLEAYELVFEEKTLEEVENSYLDIDLGESIYDKDDNEDYSADDEFQILNEQSSNNQIYSYLGFIMDCISKLNESNIDTTEIIEKLSLLEDKNIFKDIDRFQLFQNTLKEVIISYIGDDNRSYLTYMLNFNIKKLMDSMTYNNHDDIYNEIDIRLRNINNLLEINNVSLIDYFKNLQDIEGIDIIYKDMSLITENNVNVFIENIKIGLDTKINIFINMLNKGNSNILKRGNTEVLEGYQNIGLSQFWHSYKDKIIEKLFVELKDNEEYDIARKIVDMYQMSINVEKQIPIFINMLNKGNSKILKYGNKEVLEGYSNINLSRFWSSHKDRIIKRLFVELKDNEEYDIARKIVDMYQMSINVEKQISIFINMLNKGNSKILKRGNDEVLEGYPNVSLSYFWSNNKDKIIQKLFVELKDNEEYDIARKVVDMNEMLINVEKQISIFINMLNKGNSKILKRGNDEVLEGYPNINLSQFWSRNKDKVIQKLFVELKDNDEYDVARKIVDMNEMSINVENQISIFINMLNKGNSKVLKTYNKEVLEGYPDIGLSLFWSRNKDRITKRLFVELKDDVNYDIARSTVLTYFDVKTIEEYERNLEEQRKLNKERPDVEEQILIFINILNKGNSKILKQGNKEVLEGCPNIKLSQFWSRNKDKVIQKLFVELKDNDEYDMARSTILTCFDVKTIEEYEVKQRIQRELNKDKLGIKEQILIFIDMLNKGNSKILKRGNDEVLEGYQNIGLSQFWHSYKDKIIEKLFVELKDNEEYDIARKIVDMYQMSINVEKQIPIFINMLNKDNSKILKYGNKEVLEGYPNINLSQFWNSHKDRIIKRLFFDMKDNKEYNIARSTILTYFDVKSIEDYEEKLELNRNRLGVEEQILIFINMLNKGNSNILKRRNSEVLEGYPDVKLSSFWNRNKDKIIEKLFIELKDNNEYDVARKIVNINEMSVNIEKQIPIFINMLNKGNSNILKRRNTEALEGYPNIGLYQFWSQHKDKIIQKLFVELKDDVYYDEARSTVLTHFDAKTIEEYEEKLKKARELQELKKMKKMLENVDERLNTEENIGSRKRA